jgi:nondiscriminating glutamyl-tRNA synthetase
MERVRFSPAPSGRLHLGGARTALFNWLVARHSGGTFILRIEDTDRARVDPASELSILEDLTWLGLDWDEGPGIGGPYAPYRQSERTALYDATLQRLREAGRVYPCFCDPDCLEADRAADAASGVAPRYRGRCRELSPEEAGERLASGERAVWRFRVDPRVGPLAFDDLVHGPVSIDASEVGDFTLVRADGRAMYDLACVTDDAAMAVTIVIRGDDHLPNTPRQLLLYDALGLEPPRYAHLPLVHGPDGAPLSKSRGATPISALRAEGYVPAAVLDHLALLGWSDPDGREQLSREDLVAAFDLSRVSHSPAGNDPARLRRLNARHLRALPAAALQSSLAAFLPPLPAWLDRAALVEALRDGLETAADAAALAVPVIAPLPLDAEAAAALEPPAARAALAKARELVAAAPEKLDGAALLATLKSALRDMELPARETLPAVRAALTGRAHGLPLDVLLSLLGRQRAAERLEAARRS